jgi:uncharacterized protein YcbK (DUF882 family)
MTLAIFSTAAIAYIAFLRPAEGLDTIARKPGELPFARPAANAYGKSGGVRMQFALPGDPVSYPIEVAGDPAVLRYVWLPLRHGTPTEPRSLAEDMVAPREPGFYKLAVLGDTGRHVFEDLPLAVLVPMKDKSGASINGYRIGYYRGERARADGAGPAGFVQISEEDLDIRVSQHLTLADFLTHDGQTTWPRYAALDPRLLDKLELIFAEVASWNNAGVRTPIDVDVHSGFRTPLHNRRIARSAGDSRHQYGDAADIAIDADRNGRVNSADTRLVGLAVEIVEREHPDLVGGLGLYTRNGAPYVHVDTRGSRVRWRG